MEHQRDLWVGVPGVAARPAAASPIPTRSRDFLARVQANVVNMDQSGRQSMANFAERGTGDAVVTYENELLLAQQGEATDSLCDPAARRC